MRIDCIDWKRPVIFGASFGVAAVASILTAMGLFYWYHSRPRTWDASKIKGVNSTVSQTFALNGPENKFSGTGFNLIFVLENTSGSDYTVPQNLRLFERSRMSGALQEINAKLDRPFVIPAKERAEIRASIEYGCDSAEMKKSKETALDGDDCFKDEFGDVTDFVGFDDDSHTRLNLPKPSYVAAKWANGSL